MTDIYASIAQADPKIVQQLADRLELRAADPKQQAMLHAYLADVAFPDGAHVLEVGCGSGAVARVLARWPGVAQVHGIDPSPILLDRARQLAARIDNLDFREADGRALPFDADSFDVVVFHTALCHMPAPERALAEAYRVLRPGGRLAIFDGDYTTTTVATCEHDPLQACIDAAVSGLVYDGYLVRKLRSLVQAAGFDVWELRSHGYVQTSEPTYMLTLIERGAETLAAEGCIGRELAAALKAEALRRADAGLFFGHIAYASLLARKSAG
jgi:ubiquinone/menaquinone biosynthesis C-methylase UbiE